jgi:hypothetical protein
MGLVTHHTCRTLDPYPPLPLPFVHRYRYARVRIRVRFFYPRVTWVIHYALIGSLASRSEMHFCIFTYVQEHQWMITIIHKHPLIISHPFSATVKSLSGLIQEFLRAKQGNRRDLASTYKKLHPSPVKVSQISRSRTAEDNWDQSGT